jgi:hypothetical protein
MYKSKHVVIINTNFYVAVYDTVKTRANRTKPGKNPAVATDEDVGRASGPV